MKMGSSVVDGVHQMRHIVLYSPPSVNHGGFWNTCIPLDTLSTESAKKGGLAETVELPARLYK